MRTIDAIDADRAASERRGIVVSLGDKTGNAARPWAKAGYAVYCVDIQHGIRAPRVVKCGLGVLVFTWGDMRSWFPPRGRIVFMMAMPPCTQLAVSGARDFETKGGWMLAEGLQTFDSCLMACNYSRAPFWVENPVGRIKSSGRRAPDYTFHPWEYAGYLPNIQADNTSKRTCLWTGGGFVMPEKRPAPAPHRQDCWMASPDEGRGESRAETPMGFAQAVFEANQPRRRQLLSSDAEYLAPECRADTLIPPNPETKARKA